MADAGERTEPGGDRLRSEAAGQAHCGGGHRVLAVVRARQPDLLDAQDRLLVPPQVTGALRQLRTGSGAEQHTPSAAAEILDRQRRRRDRHVVVALVDEHAQLGRDVVLVAGVPVEVVGAQVQQDRGLGRERQRVLELKRGRLTDHRDVRREASDQRRCRRPHVARDRDRPARLAVHVADPLGRGRLAVGSGHRDELVGQQPPSELKLPQNGQATLTCRLNRWRISRDARALDERPGAGGKVDA